jgi:hypothetical protein
MVLSQPRGVVSPETSPKVGSPGSEVAVRTVLVYEEDEQARGEAEDGCARLGRGGILALISRDRVAVQVNNQVRHGPGRARRLARACRETQGNSDEEREARQENMYFDDAATLGRCRRHERRDDGLRSRALVHPQAWLEHLFVSPLPLPVLHAECAVYPDFRLYEDPACGGSSASEEMLTSSSGEEDDDDGESAMSDAMQAAQLARSARSASGPYHGTVSVSAAEGAMVPVCPLPTPRGPRTGSGVAEGRLRRRRHLLRADEVVPLPSQTLLVSRIYEKHSLEGRHNLTSLSSAPALHRYEHDFKQHFTARNLRSRLYLDERQRVALSEARACADIVRAPPPPAEDALPAVAEGNEAEAEAEEEAEAAVNA